MPQSETKKVTVDGREFILHQFPPMACRKFMVLYIPSMMPKIGDYNANESLLIEALSYVAVEENGVKIFLSSIELINKYATRGKGLAALELLLLDYNFDFLENGLASNFFGGLAQKAQELLTKIVNNGLAQLFQAEKPPIEK